VVFLIWDAVAGQEVNRFALVFIAFALLWPLIGPGALYDRFVEHAAWGRWKNVLRILPVLSLWFPVRLRHELAFRKAEALAKSGRLDKALGIVRGYENNDGLPDWLYCARLADIYRAAGDWDESIAMQERAVELAPDNPTVLLNLAVNLLRHRHDAGFAKELLEHAKTHAVVKMMAPAVAWVEGLLELEQGDPNQARNRLESALQSANELWVGNPSGRAHIDLIHADLAVALARVGDREQAMLHFRRAEPRLRALGQDHILRRCRDEMGLKE
jgi:tetratricopeptide (TPR) repeat protein